MAVDNPPHPAPAVNPKLAALKELAPVISGFGAVVAMIIAAIALFASLTIAPMRDEMRLMRAEMQLMRQEMQRGFEAANEDRRLIRQEMQRRFETVDAEFKAVDAEFKAVDDEFKAVRQEMQLGFKAVDDEFKAVRKDLADLSERLIRLETLLEQIIGQGQTPAPPDAE